MPKPMDGESREDYMARCIPDTMREGSERDQAVALCASYWGEDEDESKAAKFSSVTYNGMTVQATGKRQSSREGKKWERTVRHNGKERVVAWGDPDMEVRADNQDRRSAFNSRHSCDSKRDPLSPGFWACWDWNAKEGGGMDDVKEYGSYTDEEAMEERPVMVVPFGVRSFAELDAMEKAGTRQRKMGGVMEQYKAVCDNIMADPEMDANGRVGAMEALSKEMLYRMKMATENEPMMGDDDSLMRGEDEDGMDGKSADEPSPGFLRKIAEKLGLVRKESEPDLTPGFTVVKDRDGNLRWVAVFSNKFRDNDTPREIIAESAHRDFVKAADSGQWEYPELWLWHVKGTRSGVSDFVAYDDRGFTVASGTFDPGKEYVAESLRKMRDLRVSHGMPVREIARDPRDPTVIIRYRSREISPLPATKAANDLTGFVVTDQGGEVMALPKEKRDWLKDVLGDGAVSALEAGIEDKARTAQDEGLEFKEGDKLEPQQNAEPAEPPTEDASKEADAQEPQAVGPVGISRDEIADTFRAFGEALLARIDERLAPLEAEVKGMHASDDEKVKERVAGIPGASLRDIVLGSVIGKEDARVDGRTSLAKDGPAEAKANAGDGWIVNTLQSDGDWRNALAPQTER